MYPFPLNESLEQAQERESREAARQAKRDAMARFLPPEPEALSKSAQNIHGSIHPAEIGGETA